MRTVFGVKESGLPGRVLGLQILSQLVCPPLALDGAANLWSLPVWPVLIRMLLLLPERRWFCSATVNAQYLQGVIGRDPTNPSVDVGITPHTGLLRSSRPQSLPDFAVRLRWSASITMATQIQLYLVL